MDNLLAVKKESSNLNLKIIQSRNNSAPDKGYKQIIPFRDSKKLGVVLFDLNILGCPVEKAYKEFEKMSNKKPEDILFPKD